MGRDFSIACSPQERENLIKASSYLDEKMQEIQKSGRVIGVERCAIMAALNITNDLLNLQKSMLSQEQAVEKIVAIQARIDSVIADVGDD